MPTLTIPEFESWSPECAVGTYELYHLNSYGEPVPSAAFKQGYVDDASHVVKFELIDDLRVAKDVYEYIVKISGITESGAAWVDTARTYQFETYCG